MSSFASMFNNTNYKSNRFGAQHIPKEEPVPVKPTTAPVAPVEQFKKVEKRTYVPKHIQNYEDRDYNRAPEDNKPVEKKSYYKTTAGSPKSSGRNGRSFKEPVNPAKPAKVDTFTEAKVVMINKPFNFEQ